MKILHLDDHPLFMEGIKVFLGLLDDDVVVFESESVDGALPILKENSDIALILLDIEMPGMEELKGFFTLRLQFPDIPIVGLSSVNAPQTIRTFINGGAKGYILKATRSKELITAIKAVLAGEIYTPEGFCAETTETGDEYQLSKRQQEILRLIARGLPNKLIADQLFITEGTVKNHINAIFKILGVYNRTQVIIKAKEIGYH